jgi:DNA mismatch repair protein MutL
LQQSVKAGISLTEKEMKNLINDLFNCSMPSSTANGKPTYLEFKKEELDKLFGR